MRDTGTRIPGSFQQLSSTLLKDSRVDCRNTYFVANLKFRAPKQVVITVVTRYILIVDSVWFCATVTISMVFKTKVLTFNSGMQV